MVFNGVRAIRADLLSMSLHALLGYSAPDNLTMLVHLERIRKEAPRKLREIELKIADNQPHIRYATEAYELGRRFGVDDVALVLYIARRAGTTLRLSE